MAYSDQNARSADYTADRDQIDPGFVSLSVLLRVKGVRASAAEIRKRCGERRVDLRRMATCARSFGLRTAVQRTLWENLSNAVLPAIACLRDGRFLIIVRVEEDAVTIIHANGNQQDLGPTQFERIWDGRIVVLTKGASLSERFDSLVDRASGVGGNLMRAVGAILPRSAPTESESGQGIIRGRPENDHRAAAAFQSSPVPAELRRKTIEAIRSVEHGRAISACLHALPAIARQIRARVTRFIAPTGPELGVSDDVSPVTHTIGADSGLLSLLLLLRWHGVSATPEQIRHHCGTGRVGTIDMLRCAKQLGLKAGASKTSWERLSKTPLPGIAALNNGTFILLGQVAGDKVLVQRPPSPRPSAMTRAELEGVWDGQIILMTRRASLGEYMRRFDLTWFLGAIHKYRWLLSEVLVASFFLQFFGLVSPLFFQLVIDKVLVHRTMSTLDVLIIGLCGVATFESILGILRTYVFAHTTNRIDVELGARLYRHLLALPLAYFQARRVGDSVARVRELENIRQFLTGSALTLVVDLAFTVLFLIVMLYYSPLLTLIVLAGFPFYIGVSLGATPLFQHRLDEKFRRGAENQSFLVESIAGVETLKAMAVEPQMQRSWEEQLAAYVTASFRVISIGNVASQAVQWANKLVTAGILYFGAISVVEGRLSVGELVAFNMLASRVNTPVLRLAQIWQDFHQARLSVERLGDVLNMAPEPQFVAGRPMLPAIRGLIQFERVNFRYRVDEAAVLHDVSLHVEAGEVVGIVGASGSGKSTIAKLIQRLYVPESGRVRIDGVDLAMVDLAWLRRQIGVVLQESVLFNRSIRDNIALVDPTIPFDRIMTAAQLAGAHEFIMDLPEGYDTIVGERGSRLSGGQRQRIAISRALIGDPRILIFDEATSALDYESERAIQHSMREITANRTVIVIAHRLTTVRSAHRIITLDRGRVVEDGTHEELVRRDGRYAKLHKLQAGFHGAG